MHVHESYTIQEIQTNTPLALKAHACETKRIVAKAVKAELDTHTHARSIAILPTTDHRPPTTPWKQECQLETQVGR